MGEEYKKAACTLCFSGPTFIDRVINLALNTADKASKKKPYKYFVLLILTDGVIGNMFKTIDSIVYAANNSPLSIVITGIGNAGFDAMNFLDSDDRALVDSYGNVARRDIVQFVPFRDYVGCPHMLAQETLAEIPRQITDYMFMKEIKPAK